MGGTNVVVYYANVYRNGDRQYVGQICSTREELERVAAAALKYTRPTPRRIAILRVTPK